LIEENKIAEARVYMKEFAAWDGNSLIASTQRLLIKVTPKQFNYISKECLYRIEWHMQKMFGGSPAA
jgi:hypothetical protein